MKRWLILMATIVAIVSVANAKRVYYPHRWDDPVDQKHVVAPVP